MKKYPFNKLIRSKLPARMQKEGVIIHGAELSDEEYIVQLKNKIVEEAGEVLLAEDSEHLKTELADVLEVIHAIADASNIDLAEIEKTRMDKHAINGCFKASNYVHYIEVAQDNHTVIDYLNNKNRPYKLQNN